MRPFSGVTGKFARAGKTICRVCEIKPNSAEGYVALFVAFSGTSIQVVIVLITEGLTGRGLSILAFGGLSMWVATRLIIRAIDERRYRGIRGDWQEVKVFYCKSDFTLMGMGNLYPREPTLLIYANSMFNSQDDPTQKTFRPADLYFNDGFVGKPTQEETDFVTGDWGKLTVMAGMQGIRLGNPDITLDARFQRTRIPLAKIPPPVADDPREPG